MIANFMLKDGKMVYPNAHTDTMLRYSSEGNRTVEARQCVFGSSVSGAANAPLTGAEIMFGEPVSEPPYTDGWLTPDEIPKEGGRPALPAFRGRQRLA